MPYYLKSIFYSNKLINLFMRVWYWLSSKKNVYKVGAIGVLMTAASLVTPIIKDIFNKPTRPEGIYAPITIKDVSGSTIKITQNFESNLTKEQYLEFLERNKALIISERANSSDIELINKKLAAIEAQHNNLEKSYQETLKDNKELSWTLAQLRSKDSKVTHQEIINAQIALQNGDTSKADSLLNEIEKSVDEPISIAANAAYQRAKIANNTFRWEDALELANKAVRLQPKNETFLSFYADLLLKTGNETEAQKIYEESLQLNISKYGGNSINTAEQYNRLAQAYASSNFTISELHYLKAIEIVKKYPDKHDLSIGNFYSNLAKLYQEHNYFPQAEANHLKAIEIHERFLPSNHPDLAIDYNNFGGLYHLQKNYSKAEFYFLKAIFIEEKNSQTNPSSLARHYYNLALIYREQRFVKKAKPLLIKTVAIYKKHPPANSEEIIGTYALLASTLFNLKDYESAEPYYKFLVEKLTVAYGSNHIWTRGFLREYILCLKNQGEDIRPVLNKYNLRVTPLIK